MRIAALATPLTMVLGFATWTLLLLIATVGLYRWGRILRLKAPIASFRSDRLEGDDWYQRGTRAHANCVENLPVFAAIVLVITATGITGPDINSMCAIILVARICQSLVHVCFVQTNAVVAVRFSFFSVQLVCFLALIVIAISRGT